jgi:hypothetical protein
MAEGVGHSGSNPADRFSQENSLPHIDPCQLMIARTRRMSQTVIEVEAK